MKCHKIYVWRNCSDDKRGTRKEVSFGGKSISTEPQIWKVVAGYTSIKADHNKFCHSNIGYQKEIYIFSIERYLISCSSGIEEDIKNIKEGYFRLKAAHKEVATLI